jgi:hypothetical protein
MIHLYIFFFLSSHLLITTIRAVGTTTSKAVNRDRCKLVMIKLWIMQANKKPVELVPNAVYMCVKCIVV